jgi:small subunit ribosomal protein S3
MGNKVNPVGYRIGISKDWESKWFADKKNYSKYAIQDANIRKVLEQKFDLAGLRNIEINRSLNDIKVTVHVSKPGVVIGKGGSIVTSAKEELEKMTKSKVSISAESVKVPELEAKLVGDFIARQLKRRKPYRSVINSAITAAMDKGAKGIKIKIAGVIGGPMSIARSEYFSKGSVPNQTLRADIDFAQIHCQMLFGTIGLKVWIYKGEKDIR